MNSSTWHFYVAATGLFTGASFTGTDEMLQAQIDHLGPGLGAYSGEVDYLTQRVSGLELELVDYQPPAPPATDLLTWTWNVETKRWLSEPTVAARLSAARLAYEAAAQALLDGTAQGWGYDSLLSAASYANSTVAQFRAEAETLMAWRDALWSTAYSIETQVAAGDRALPETEQDFLALLPEAPARPKAPTTPLT